MKFTIQKLSRLSGDQASIYAVMVDGEKGNRLEQFIEHNRNDHKDEVVDILARLSAIGKQVGARIEFFKEREGLPGDLVSALYDKPRSKLRLYCIRFGKTTLILGGGGVKPKDIRAWQENGQLTREAELMILVSKLVAERIKDKDIRWVRIRWICWEIWILRSKKMIKNSKEEKTGSVIDDLLNEIPEKKMKKVAACMRLAARIADLMAGAGYSKSSFAALLGKEPSVITKWLSGTHNFTYETLLDITMALDVEMAALHEEKKPEVVEVAHVAITGVRSWYSPVANELHEIGYQRNHRNYGFYGEPGKVQINPFPAKVEQKPEFVMVENSHHQISYSQGSIKKKSTIRRKNSPIQGSYE